MSTKAIESDNRFTNQARPTWFDSIKAAAGSLATAGTFDSAAKWNVTAAYNPSSIYEVSEKAAEAARQIERIKAIASRCPEDESDSDVRLDSYASSMALIGSLLSGPIPIPVASRGEEGCASLFFDGNGFYGDLEIRGKWLEYYLKSSKNGKILETFDCEEMTDGYIPPRLLMCLFAHYAR